MPRFVRDEELIAAAIHETRRGLADVQRPTGTERARTKDVAVQAADDAGYAKNLAEQLEGELGPLPGQIQSALDDAQAALSEAGLARSDAASAVEDAQQAAADASQAISDALAAATLAAGANTWADVAPTSGDAAGKPVGAVWFQYDGAGLLAAVWELRPLGWVQREFDETIIPQVAIGTGTYGSLSGSRIVARSILAEHIATLAITAEELAANAVTAVKIAANAVTAEKINAGAVTTEKLDALAVTAEKIAAGAIIADKIAANAITTAKLAADAIDGMTITGAVIRTAPSGQRMQFDVNGLSAYNASGTRTLSLSSSGGGFIMTEDANNSIGFSTYSGIRYQSTHSGYSGVGRFILEPKHLWMLNGSNDAVDPGFEIDHTTDSGDNPVVSMRVRNAKFSIQTDGDASFFSGGGGDLHLGFNKLTTTRVEAFTAQLYEIDVPQKIKFGFTSDADSEVPLIETSGLGRLLIRAGTTPGNNVAGNNIELVGQSITLDAPTVQFQGRNIATERLQLCETKTSGNQGSITTTEVTITGISVPFTLAEPAQIRLGALLRAYSSSTTDVLSIKLKDNGTTIAEWTKQANSAGTATVQNHDMTIQLPFAAGSHSITMTVARAAGSGTVTVAPTPTGPVQIRVEEIVLSA